MGYNVYGFELGHEASRKVHPAVFAEDCHKLRGRQLASLLPRTSSSKKNKPPKIAEYLEKLWPDKRTRPKLIAPGLGQEEALWLRDFLVGGASAIDVVSSIYSGGMGTNKALADHINHRAHPHSIRRAVEVTKSLHREYAQANSQLWLTDLIPASTG